MNNKLQNYWTERTNITVITSDDMDLANKYLKNTINNRKITGIIEKLQFYRDQALNKQFNAWLRNNKDALKLTGEYPQNGYERDNLKMVFASEKFNYDPVKDNDLIDFFKNIVDEKNTYGYHCEVIRLEDNESREEAIENLEKQVFEAIDPGTVVTKELQWKNIEEEVSLNPYVDLSQYPPKEEFIDGVYREYLKLTPKNVVIIGEFTEKEIEKMMRDLITYERRHFIRVWHTLTEVMEKDEEGVPEEIQYFNSVIHATPYCKILDNKTYSEQLIHNFD